uniref:hypothetical protein n=1 Tax=Aeromonas dhakensis TaxID=196024 RepID=UPI002DD43FA9|nr:hypothetical protein [Aeromonas dhakensis]
MKGGKKLGKQPQARAHRINEEIRLKEVRLTGLDGEAIGITSIQDALNLGLRERIDGKAGYFNGSRPQVESQGRAG